MCILSQAEFNARYRCHPGSFP
uniref:Uncharacterized protein n=1 Tax=Anguilla anguilla TaxID=7936 RepID=A0A0E9SM47_ANGAN